MVSDILSFDYTAYSYQIHDSIVGDLYPPTQDWNFDEPVVGRGIPLEDEVDLHTHVRLGAALVVVGVECGARVEDGHVTTGQRSCVAFLGFPRSFNFSNVELEHESS